MTYENVFLCTKADDERRDSSFALSLRKRVNGAERFVSSSKESFVKVFDVRERSFYVGKIPFFKNEDLCFAFGMDAQYRSRHRFGFF